MLLPAAFGSIEDSCNHLKKDVQVWDVAAERQVEIFGKDAAKLVQLMTCRDLSKSKIGRCYYCPIIDDNGNIYLNNVTAREVNLIPDVSQSPSVGSSQTFIAAGGGFAGFQDASPIPAAIPGFYGSGSSIGVLAQVYSPGPSPLKAPSAGAGLLSLIHI